MDDLMVKSLIAKEQEYLRLAEYNTEMAKSCRNLLNDLTKDMGNEIKIKNPIIVTNNEVIKLPEGTKRSQTLWFLKNYLTKSATMPEIQKLWNKTIGNSDDITMTVRWLKNNGDIAKKSYGSNNATYWGLSQWFDKDKSDFKEEYKSFNNVVFIDYEL